MSVWVISRIPVKASNGKRLSIYDPETGGARFGYNIGYVKTEKEAQRILAHYKRYASMHYRYQLQQLDVIHK